MRPSWSLLLLAMAVALSATSRTTAGQTVEGSVVEERTAQPVVGAFVVLVEEEGRDRAAAMTDQRGRYTLSAPAPGRYRLRVDRIGYRATLSPEFDLAGSQTLKHDLVARVDAVQLAEIALATERVCDTPPAEVERISEVWEEARKALTATSWTQREERYRLTMRKFERRRAPRSGHVEDEWSAVWVGVNNSSPFVSLPPEKLAAEGYARSTETSTRYFAPDAAVLLSEDFADTHCFRLRPPDAEHPGMVGLGFEPEEEREVVDVEGALWIDERSAELKLLEYVYTGLSKEVTADQAGGRVAFERLPSGAWIVSDWQINAPAIRRGPEIWYERVLGGFQTSQSSRTRDAVVAVLQTGGSVEQIHALDGTLLRGHETSAVSGTVRDSLRDEPLAGAAVSIRNTAYRTTSDSMGAYRIGGIPPGRYTIVAHHARLDSLGIPPIEQEIALKPGTSERAELAVPSLTTLLASTCGEETNGAAVVGFVRDGTSGAPLATARILFAWGDGEGQLGRREIAAGGSGHYVVCGVPRGQTIVARAEFPGRAAREVFAVPSARRSLRQDFDLTPARLESVITVVGQGGGGPAAIGGWVVDDGTGAPLAGAQVSLPGARTGAVADAEGRFLVANVDPGSHVVEVELLGYAPAHASVEVEEDGSLSLAARLVREPLAADPLEVATEAPPLAAGSHSVYRVTSEEIERYPVMGLVELLAVTVPGVEVGFDQKYGCLVPLLRPQTGLGTGPLSNRSASPLVVVEGTPLSNPCELMTMNPSDVEEIEIVSALAGANRYGWRGGNGVILVEIKDRVRKPGEAQEESPRPEEPREPAGDERVD